MSCAETPLPNTQNLPERLQIRLDDTDLFLFTGGACHVFAKELLSLMPDEEFVPKRLMMQTDQGNERLIHVFLLSHGYAVDCLGIRRVEDLLAFYYGYYECKHPSFCVEDFDLEKCFINSDPNQTTESLRLRGPLNHWGLFLHPEFLKKAAARAQQIIREAMTRYSVLSHLRGKSLMYAEV